MSGMRSMTRGGFSLVEMTLVLLIMGLLAAVAVVFASGQSERAKQKATFASMDVVANALTQYNLDHSAYPAVLDVLLQTKPPYLDPRKPPMDGWGKKFAYQTPGLNEHPYELLSSGADGKHGTADDLDVWKPKKD